MTKNVPLVASRCLALSALLAGLTSSGCSGQDASGGSSKSAAAKAPLGDGSYVASSGIASTNPAATGIDYWRVAVVRRGGRDSWVVSGMRETEFGGSTRVLDLVAMGENLETVVFLRPDPSAPPISEEGKAALVADFRHLQPAQPGAGDVGTRDRLVVLGEPLLDCRDHAGSALGDALGSALIGVYGAWACTGGKVVNLIDPPDPTYDIYGRRKPPPDRCDEVMTEAGSMASDSWRSTRAVPLSCFGLDI
jgi:hypothetical protein